MRQLSADRKIRILYVITKSNWGGAQRYVYDLATHAPKDIFEISVALGGNGLLKARLEQAGIRTIPLPDLERDIRLSSDWRMTLALIRLFRKEQPAVVHLNSSKAGGIGALAGRIARVPKIIFTAHGWAFNEERPRWQKMLIKWLARITVMLSHITIAVSAAVKNDIGHFPGSKKIKVIRNGIDMPDFLPTEEALATLRTINPGFASRYQVQPPKYLIGSLAELHPVKNLEAAIGAINTLPAALKSEIAYLVFGEGEERTKLERQITECNLRDTVFLLGFVPDAATLLKALDIFILPSRSEALALAALEAGAAALPVIASNVGGLPEIIKNGKDGILVPAGNKSALREAIEKTLGDEELRLSLGNSLRDRVKTEFSLEKMAMATLELYR